MGSSWLFFCPKYSLDWQASQQLDGFIWGLVKIDVKPELSRRRQAEREALQFQ